MSKHRITCTNSLCRYVGMMDAVPERTFVKKHFLEMKKAKSAATAHVSTALPELMQIRCPKCGARWRLRADRLH